MHGIVLRGSPDKNQAFREFLDEKLEQRLSRLDKMPKYLKRGVPYGNNVIAVIRHAEEKPETFYGESQLTDIGKRIVEQIQLNNLLAEAQKEFYFGGNLVGDAGDIFYAQRGANDAVTNNFNTHELGSGSQSAVTKADDRSDLSNKISGTQKLVTSPYPNANDTDTDNTGRAADVTTWLHSYTTTDFNHTGVTGGIITVSGPGASAPILTRYTISSYAKTSTDTLKVFTNHNANGV